VLREWIAYAKDDNKGWERLDSIPFVKKLHEALKKMDEDGSDEYSQHLVCASKELLDILTALEEEDAHRRSFVGGWMMMTHPRHPPQHPSHLLGADLAKMIGKMVSEED
jgi:hypothetical protein